MHRPIQPLLAGLALADDDAGAARRARIRRPNDLDADAIDAWLRRNLDQRGRGVAAQVADDDRFLRAVGQEDSRRAVENAIPHTIVGQRLAVRVAEDAATVDVISGGRFQLGVGIGYKVEEFESFAIPSKERAGRTNEGLEIIRRLWAGETLTFKGKYYEIRHAKLSPAPVQQPRPPLWVGGFTPAAIRRAARYADGYIGTGPLTEFYKQYVTALHTLGKPTTNLQLAGGFFWLIPSTDPEKTWHEAAEHVLYQVNGYAEWLEKA